MITFLIFLVITSAAVTVYVPNRKDINSIAHSSYRLLQIKAEKRRDKRENAKPQPSIDQFLREQYKAKAIEREKERSIWTQNFNRELRASEPQKLIVGSKITTGLITSKAITADEMRVDTVRDLEGWLDGTYKTRGAITQYRRLPASEELSYTQRYITTNTNIYSEVNNGKVVGTISAGEVIDVVGWTKNSQGIEFLQMNGPVYFAVGATSTKSTSGLPYIETPKPPITHTEYDTYTVQSIDRTFNQTYQSPYTTSHPLDQKCHLC